MTNTLCIETSSEHCSVALSVDGRVFARNAHLRRSHNEHLLSMLDELFVQAGITPRDIDLVGFGCGPGSFTGVRIAAAATQAIAVAAEALVVPIATSRVWVESAAAKNQPNQRVWVCAVRSRGTTYYLSLFRIVSSSAAESDHIECLISDVLVDAWPQDFADAIAQASADTGQTCACVGNPPPWLPKTLGEAWFDCVPDATPLLALTHAQFELGRARSPEFALPAYVQGDSPWRPSQPANPAPKASTGATL